MLAPARYADWLHEEVFLPTIVVIGTEAAKVRAKETNGLSLAELFAPFGGFYRRLPATCHSLEKQIQVENMCFRFTDADSATQWTAQQAEKVAAAMVEAVSPKNPNDPKPQTPPGPWYEQWRLAMFRSLRWSEHEGLDQPVTAMLVVSSKESDPLHLFEQLLHSSNMPPLCTQGVLDPVPARAAVLLHDMSDPDSPSVVELEAKLDLVRARFSPHLCLAVQINRGIEANPEIQELFKPHLVAGKPAPPPPPPDAAGNDSITAGHCQHLGQTDMDALWQAASQVISKSAIPWMETQLQQLESQISQTRKGFRNQLKYLWRKPRESAGGVQPSPEERQDSNAIYPLQTTEGQMRLAGDLAFMLRDYEAALGYYRSVVSDYKQDKSWKHAAGAYEMWGLCGYITNSSRTEAERCMENAYEHYLKAGAGRHAMRAVSLHLAMVCENKEAAARLMKVNGDMSDTGLRSALILEQAANLYAQAGSIRKSAFHMVLAGHTFNKLQFKKLALHCYSSVVSMYKEKRWYHIIDHFHFTMARQAFGLGFLAESMANFISLLNSFAIVDKRTSIQAERETTYLKEFLFVVRNWIEKCNPSEDQKAVDLEVPVMAPEIVVLLPDELAAAATVSASLTSTLSEEKPSTPQVPWELLGEKLVRALPADDRLELQWRNKHEEKVFDSLQRVTAVGAKVCVEMVLTNPMRVKLELSHARLGGQLEESAPVPQDADAAADAGADLVEFPEENIVLGPLESKRIRLAVIPQREGLLKIQRFTWSLFDQVLCSRPLQVKGRRMRATLEQRASEKGVYSIDKRLELKVRSRVPRISARIENWPESSEAPLLMGELRSCTLVLEAGGAGDQGAAKSLRIATSHPSFLACAAPEAEGDATKIEGEVLVYNGSLRGQVKFPIALRADAVGRHAVRICILAEAPQDAASGESIPKSELRQWVTLQEQLTVQPSISCTVVQNPSLQDTERFLFSFAMENKSVDTIEVCRVRCSREEQESALEECVQTGSSRHQAGPGQLVHLLFAYQRGGSQSSEAQLTASRERKQLLQASRANSNEALRDRGKKTSSDEHLDLIVEWGTRQGAKGEIYLLNVPYGTPTQPGGTSQAQSHCPLALHLLAPDTATLSPDLLVPVTLCVRNASNANVSFFYLADASQEFVWLGCERSEVIQLPPQATHRATLHAHFPTAGIFNLNKFRLHVVRSSSSSSKSAEQAPLAFTLPVDKLIHILEA